MIEWNIHPTPCDMTHAEVRRVFEREWLYLEHGGESLIDMVTRVAVSLGARAHGALRCHPHGPNRPLDGSAIAANRPHKEQIAI